MVKENLGKPLVIWKDFLYFTYVPQEFAFHIKALRKKIL